MWQWGQFIDHDLDLSPDSSGEAFPVMVPAGDPVFPDGSMIPLMRSMYDPGTGTGPANPRQQMNVLTSWIDASQVYGSDAARAAWLRTADPLRKGQLEVSAHATGDLMPFNDGTQANAGPLGTAGFVAGDVRSNEQAGLASIHTLFVREHNLWAEAFASADPGLSSDDVYERARRVVGAEMQMITYNEFLPTLLGPGAPGAYSGYDDSVDGSVRNEFAAALFRVGHTMLSPTIKRLGSDGMPIPEGNLPLQNAFFNPGAITDEGGIDPILRGLASQVMQKVDAHIVDDVRNLLFGPPGAGGMDLASLNIQRGRDHGLPDYNTVRAALGLPVVTSFDQITSDVSLAAALRSVYGQTMGSDNVQLVDLWVGAISEDHLPGSSVGELLSAGIALQFDLVRTADRFYYENDADLSSMLGELGLSLADLEERRLSTIIMDNTGIVGLPDNVFLVPGPGAGALLALGGLAAARRRRQVA
jgi:hypothetical protein